MKSLLSPKRVSAALLLTTCISLSSCKKDSQTTPPPAQDDMTLASEAVQSNNLATTVFDNIFNLTQSVSEDDAGEQIGLGAQSLPTGRVMGIEGTEGGAKCYTTTVAPKIRGEWPKTVTIDFGDGCKSPDGKIRKGKIISIFTKPAYLPGAIISTTFDGYTVDSFAIAGTHKVTNTSTAQRISFKIEVINGKLTSTNTGVWHRHESNHEFTQLDDVFAPLNPFKSGYKITGTSKGGNSLGWSWHTEIVTPLIQRFNCHWISKGVLKIWWQDNPTAATLDFGDGTCDDQAVLSYKDHSKTITLK